VQLLCSRPSSPIWGEEGARRVQLAQQAKEILGQSDLVIITERVDDVALLIGQMVKMGLPEVLDRHIPRHWTHRGISWGWTAVGWLAYIVTEGDPRQVSVEAYLKGMHHTLSRLTAQVIEPLDFSDARLSHLLKHLSKPAYWHQMEHDLNARSIAGYDLSQGVIRCDATTVSGEHEVTAGGLLQLGHSKDDPTRPQSKVMRGSLEPLGMPLATDVLSGERAEDGLYIPIIERIQSGLNKTGLLFVGDCKMSALDTRAYLARHQDWYLSPLPLPGAPAEAMDTWITVGVTKSEAGEFTRIWRTTDRGHEVLAAEGYEFERSCAAPGATGDTATWNERGVVVRSPMHADQQAAGLEKRLRQAETKLAPLTPLRGRGQRHITAEATFMEAMALVLKAHRVDGLLHVAWEKQVEQTTQYVGRGRGAVHREKRVIEKTRSHITQVARQADRLAALRRRLGWKALVTKAGPTRLSWQEAVLCYRHEYRVERIFHRLKSRVHIAPLFVKLNEQIEGLTYLLTLGVRVLTVMEFVLRRSLEQAQASLPGLPPENKHMVTDKPTAERILKAFADVSLTIIKSAAGEDILRRLTPLSGLQEDILQRLGLGATLYLQLEIQAIGI
jgi:transposase